KGRVHPGSARGAIILTYGASDVTGLVDNLVGAQIPRSQIVMVSQSDGTSRRPVNTGQPGVIIEVQRNVGYGAGMNIGLEALPSTVQSVLLLTPGVAFT